MLKTPHIALLALDIMDVLGVSYQVMGGPSHCCGIKQLHAGDIEMAGRMGSSTMEKLSHSKSGQVISWCPSCYVQFTELTMPTIERQRGSRPFEMTPFMRFLQGRVAQLKPHLQRRVEMRVALHRHPGVAGVMEAAAEMLAAIPGVELIDLKQPAVGLQSVNVGVLPSFKRELQLNELQAACDAGVDALVAVYHSDHRELCAHERDWPFRIINILEVIGESIGLHRQDRYKQLKIMQAADQIVAECSDLIAKHSLDAGNARNIVAKAMLGRHAPGGATRERSGAMTARRLSGVFLPRPPRTSCSGLPAKRAPTTMCAIVHRGTTAAPVHSSRNAVRTRPPAKSHATSMRMPAIMPAASWVGWSSNNRAISRRWRLGSSS